jgi:hypothetical protein
LTEKRTVSAGLSFRSDVSISKTTYLLTVQKQKIGDLIKSVVTNTQLGWKPAQLIWALTLEQLLLVEAAKGNGADDNTLQKIRNYRKLGL